MLRIGPALRGNPGSHSGYDTMEGLTNSIKAAHKSAWFLKAVDAPLCLTAETLAKMLSSHPQDVASKFWRTVMCTEAFDRVRQGHATRNQLHINRFDITSALAFLKPVSMTFQSEYDHVFYQALKDLRIRRSVTEFAISACNL